MHWFEEETSQFRDMYIRVTNELEQFLDNPDEAGAVTKAEKDWFGYLICHFMAEYYKWRDTGKIIRYLEHFPIKSHRALRLVGHIYLHVAYDLPRVIADSLPQYVQADGGTASIDLTRARNLYIKANSVFVRLMEEVGGEWSIMGGLSIFTRWRPFESPFRILGYWVISLRLVAWIYGETLSSQDLKARARLENQLLDALHLAVTEMLKKKPLRYTWISWLLPPTYEGAFLVLGFQAVQYTSPQVYVPLIGGTMLLLLFLYWWTYYSALRWYADCLGREIYHHVTRAMASDLDTGSLKV